MGRQVFEHDADQLGFWIMKVDEITHALGEVAGNALICGLGTGTDKIFHSTGHLL
jgi:hypothetical protein